MLLTTPRKQDSGPKMEKWHVGESCNLGRYYSMGYQVEMKERMKICYEELSHFLPVLRSAARHSGL